MARIVVALGGNALLGPDQDGTVHEQFANARAALCRSWPFLPAACRSL